MKLILASGSPRRKEIMTKLGYEYEIIKAKKDEVTANTVPSKIVEELSYNKAVEVKDEIIDKYLNDYPIIILAADTLVSVDDKVLGKPNDRDDAFNMISLIKNRSHQVYTGVSILCIDKNKNISEITFSEKTDVIVKDMTDKEILEYIATGECDDKAGAYAIQGIFGRYIEGFVGDYDNVVGLPGKLVDKRIKEILNELG